MIENTIANVPNLGEVAKEGMLMMPTYLMKQWPTRLLRKQLKFEPANALRGINLT